LIGPNYTSLFDSGKLNSADVLERNAGFEKIRLFLDLLIGIGSTGGFVNPKDEKAVYRIAILVVDSTGTELSNRLRLRLLQKVFPVVVVGFLISTCLLI